MSTKVYGCSDDLIEFEGDVSGEFACYGTDDQENGALVMLSDGTVLEVKYGKDNRGIWEIKLKERGSLFETIEQCTCEDATPYSDVALFRDGLMWAYASSEDWQRVQ